MNNDKRIEVLVVEDDKALCYALREKLGGEGFTVSTAKDGEEGLKTAIEEKPDIILLDLIMPKMNGIEMLMNLREDDWGKTVPVLVLSNDDDPEHINETLKRNASDYLIKSDWELEDVTQKIMEILKL
ncbi:MAG: response regulator [Patescibacteria group bacterium]|jgi:DNA-binding response OmpR family regulator